MHNTIIAMGLTTMLYKEDSVINHDMCRVYASCMLVTWCTAWFVTKYKMQEYNHK